MWVLILSIIEAAYLSYTFHFLETSVDFNIMDSPSNILFKHATGNAKVGRICLFGQYAIVALIAILLLRCCIDTPAHYVLAAVALALLIGLINLNAFAYLLPVAIIEAYLYHSQPSVSSYSEYARP